MTSRRSLLVRITLAVVGMLLFCVFVYGALGWAVWSNQLWLERTIGQSRFLRWHSAYANVAAVLLPGDQDGDGVCDGLELFLHTNPRLASDHPDIQMVWAHGGFTAYPTQELYDGGINVSNTLLAQPGKRLQVRGRMLVAAELPIFPRGFRVKLTPPSYASLALPDGQPMAGPLVVPVGRDGSVAFDLLVPVDSVGNLRMEESLVTANAATGENFYSMKVRRIWAGPIVTPTMEEFLASPGPSNSASTRLRMEHRVLLRWPSVTDTVVVEAARDVDGAEWIPIRAYPRFTTATVILQSLTTNSLNTYTRPLKFRVVPIRFSPPGVPADTPTPQPAR